MSAPAAATTDAQADKPATNPAADAAAAAADADSDDEAAGASGVAASSSAADASLTPEERAAKAAAKKKKKAAAAKRKKAEAAAAAAANASSGEAAAAAADAELAALGSDFASHSMHAYFSPERNGTSLRFDSRKGRHVVAAKPLPAATSVFEMEAYAGVVSDAYVHAFCARCFQTAPQMLCCGKCQHARFCSARCRDAMSAVHNLECAALSRLPLLKLESESAPLRILMRIAFLQQQERFARKNKEAGVSASASSGRKVVWTPSPGASFADCASLISHESEYSAADLTQILLVINRLHQVVIQDEEIWTCAELSLPLCRTILLAVQCNAAAITYALDRTLKIGIGLFLPAAYLNHSCRPNCDWFFDNDGRMVMRALRPIAAGEEITYSYIQLYQSRTDRHAELKRIYYIRECLCDRCSRTQEKNSEDAFMRMLLCSKCGTNPLLAIEKPAKEGEADAPASAAASAGSSSAASSSSSSSSGKWPVLRLDSSSGAQTCPSCATVYSAAAVAELLSETRLLSERATLMLQSADHADALAFLEEQLLYAPAPRSPSQPFFHPYHAALFNTYLLSLQAAQRVASSAAASTAAGSEKEARAAHLRALRYASFVLECLRAQRLDAHALYASTLVQRGDVLAELEQERQIQSGEEFQGETEDSGVVDVPRVVRKDGQGAADSMPTAAAAAAAPSSGPHRLTVANGSLHLATAAWSAYDEAQRVFTVAHGPKHAQAAALDKLLHALQKARDMHTKQGVYDPKLAALADEFEADSAAAAAASSGKGAKNKKATAAAAAGGKKK